MNIIGGDWRFFYPENLSYFATLPQIWDSSLNTGIGIVTSSHLWINTFLHLSVLFSRFGLSWNVITLIFWIIPIIIITFYSSFNLFSQIIPNKKFFSYLSGLLYVFNTYFLMIFGGGQFGVAFAYGLVPLVVSRILKFKNSPTRYNAIFFGLILSFQILFDPRIFVITLVPIFVLLTSDAVKSPKKYMTLLLISILIICMIHSYWIVPLIYDFSENVSNQIYKSIDSSSISFFSFATFENALSLLHPNWPENIFGKVSFQKPDFLIIPLIAYSWLLFVGKKLRREDKIIMLITLVSMLGIFLSKGTNPPFGAIYQLLAEKIPGFSVYRDPSKFYILIAFAYAQLIPFSIFKCTEFVKNQRKINALFISSRTIIIIVFVVFWAFTLRELFIGKLSGIYILKNVPLEYVQLKNFIVEQNQSFRTLWIPGWHRLGYFSPINPAIGRGELFSEASISGMLRDLKNPETEKKLFDYSVKYVIVPYDTDSEFFTDDRKYDDSKYISLFSELEEIPYLKRTKQFGKIVVYQVVRHGDRFSLVSKNGRVAFDYLSPTKYTLHLSGVQVGDTLIFSEKHNPNWIAIDHDNRISSERYREINKFKIERGGNYTLEIIYKMQKYVNFLLIISGVTIVFVSIYLFRNKDK